MTKEIEEIRMVRYLSRRLLPLAAGIWLLITILGPLTFWIIEHRNLHHFTNLYAEGLAEDFNRLALEAPTLWKYQAYKFNSLVDGFHPAIDVLGFSILDEKGTPITGYEYKKGWERHGMELTFAEDLKVTLGTAPIVFNNHRIGSVEVLVSDVRLLQACALQSCFSALVGTALALLVYRFPVRVARRMEREIEELVSTVQHSEERYRSLVEESLVGVYIIVDGKFRYVNPKMSKIFGWSVEELIDKKGPVDLTLPEDWPIVDQNLRKRLTGEITSIDYKFRGITKDQSVIFLEVFGCRFIYQGQPAVIGTLLDITERRRAEDELRKFSLAVEQCPVSIVITDTAGTIEYVNPAFTRITHYSSVEAVGQNPRILKSGQTAPEVYTQLWQVITSGREWGGEFLNKKKDGEFFWEAASIFPITDANGSITNFMGIKEDITARKRADQALQGERQRLFSLLESLPGFVCLQAQDYSIPYANRYFRECIGEVEGRLCYQLFHGRDKPCEVCPTFQVFADNKLNVWEWKDRDNRTYQVYDYPFIDVDGSPLVLELGIDISDRKRAEETVRILNEELELRVGQKTRELLDAHEELVRKEKLATLGQLSGSVGHELRNPLGVMSNAIYFLKMVHADGDEITREYLDIIKSEIETSQRIITDLLDFARTKPPQTKLVTAKELVGQSIGRCTIPGCVTLLDEVPENLPPLNIDPLQMGQVLQNLITNGIQAMPEGGALRVAARLVQGSRFEVQGSADIVEHGTWNVEPDGDLVEISVADSGEGISEENMRKLFQPLFTTKAKGIGLGLVVCRNLVEANGGRIEVESRLGEGTTFTLILPVIDDGPGKEKAT